MKNLFFLIFTIVVIQPSYCQINNIGDWIFNFNVGLEAHDKRLYDYSDKESLLEMQSEVFGTYYFEFNISKKIWNKKKLSSVLGLGIGYEKATFIRPFDHYHFMKDSFRILRIHDRYMKLKASLSLKIFYEIKNKWFATGELTSNFLLLRSIDNSILIDNDIYPYSENTFELDDINLHLGINYKIKNLLLGLEVRILNVQRIDKIIFNDIINDPRSDQTWELDNPISGRFSIGFMF
jgi:hypothetical protein